MDRECIGCKQAKKIRARHLCRECYFKVWRSRNQDQQREYFRVHRRLKRPLARAQYRDEQAVRKQARQIILDRLGCHPWDLARCIMALRETHEKELIA